ncbi:MAG: phage tail sheath subtilisin-like domain-containing protein [Allosphingosinicella sp.]|uniref:phage tail sheath subtilisin-like domain-containing protein n=1 Tax=Allosphingosinicella sp. TaxID=2823234 RepID=UPI00394A9BFC
MPDVYHHGITVTEINEGLARAIRTVATSVIGLVVTAPAASAALFPLDRPVLVTDVDAAAEAVGAAGTARVSLRAIADQVRTPVVMVRVAPGADAEATSAAVIGGTVDGKKTGMQALLAAQAQLGVRPRILGCPGLDTEEVTTALAIVAKRLRGMAYAYALGDDIPAAILYRGGFAARELMLLRPDFLAFDGNAAAPSYAVARALGLRARIDKEIGWHKTISNVAVDGVVGLTEDIQWDLQDPDTEAGLLNAADITTLIHDDGYRFWGSRTCSDDPLFAFESAVRTAQVLADTMAEGTKWMADKPLHPGLMRDGAESVNEKLRQMKRDGLILGGRCWFDADANPPAQLAAGKASLDYDYTPVPPLEHLNLRQRITDRYFLDFGRAVAAG